MNSIVVHGWNINGKSLTACGLSWIYGRASKGKDPLKMGNLSSLNVSCKRCLKSRYLRKDEK